MGEIDQRWWKVGELARATGLTIRALHHYDELGLLVPSERTQAGHRLYDPEDVRRLYRIVALRRLSLPLEEVAAVLEDESVSLADTVRRHLERVERDLRRQQRLRRRLAQILFELDRNAEPTVDQFIDALEVMAMVETTLEDVVVPFIRDPDKEGSGGIPPDGQPVMLLREQKGERVLAIFIGYPEGNALALELAGVELPRPLTQDFMVGLIEAAGARVERVCISRFGDNTFSAAVAVASDGDWQEVDARPSDALNLAVRLGAPIYVDAEVMDQWAAPSGEDVRAKLTACGGPQREAGYSPDTTEWRSLRTLLGTRAVWKSS